MNKDELLQEIDLILYHNDFESIPKEIGNLVNLETLHLCYSNIYEIPKEIIIRISFNGNSYTSSQQTDNSFDKTVINSNVADLWEIAPLRSNVLRKKSADKTLLLSNVTIDKIKINYFFRK